MRGKKRRKVEGRKERREGRGKKEGRREKKQKKRIGGDRRVKKKGVRTTTRGAVVPHIDCIMRTYNTMLDFLSIK